MNTARSMKRRVRKRANGVNLAADINAQIAVNTGGSSGTTVSHSAHNTAITQTSKAVDDDRAEDREKR